MSKLNVYWWRSPEKNKNLGDELTSSLLSRYFGVEHQLAPMPRAQLVSTGSILGWLPAQRKTPCGIVGSGLMYPMTSIEGLQHARVYSVRGYLTSQLLAENLPHKPLIGDPGLLISQINTKSYKRKYTYGLIPHYSKIDSKAFLSRFNGLNSLTVIDFRTDDIDAIIEQMLSCDIILSQALHGLILADSLCLPNVWINTDTLHRGGEFKFYDYFSTVGRPFDLGIFKNTPINQHSIHSGLFEIKRTRLYSVQQEIHEAFCQFFTDFKTPYSLENSSETSNS